MTLLVPKVADTQPRWNRRSANTTNRIRNTLTGVKDDADAISAAMPATAPGAITADHVVADTERWIINNKTGSACALTLPAAADFEGRELHVKTIQAQAVNSATSNVVPLIGGAAGTAIVTGTAGKWATLVSDGTSWIIMAGN